MLAFLALWLSSMMRVCGWCNSQCNDCCVMCCLQRGSMGILYNGIYCYKYTHILLTLLSFSTYYLVLSTSVEPHITYQSLHTLFTNIQSVIQTNDCHKADFDVDRFYTNLCSYCSVYYSLWQWYCYRTRRWRPLVFVLWNSSISILGIMALHSYNTY